MGNPVRQEIVAVRREVDSLRKQIELLTEENLVYRKHVMKLLQGVEGGATEFTHDLMTLAAGNGNDGQQKQPGGATVQGGGFRR